MAFLMVSTFTFSQIYLIGPTFHYNIGGGLRSCSWGIEFSYWKWEGLYEKDLPPIGFDLGMEFDKTKKRFYSEIQTGAFIGTSIGYVYEFDENSKTGGFQASVWGAFYGGFELRYRKSNNINTFAPGSFVKLPIYKREPSLFGGVNVNFGM